MRSNDDVFILVYFINHSSQMEKAVRLITELFIKATGIVTAAQTMQYR